MGVGARGMKSLVDYCKGPDEKQRQNQGHGHRVRRRSEALWEDRGIVGGVRHCGRMGTLWEDGGIVGGVSHCGGRKTGLDKYWVEGQRPFKTDPGVLDPTPQSR